GGEIGVDRAARKIAQAGFASDAEGEPGGPVRRLEYPKQALVEYQLPGLAGPEHPPHLGGMDKRPPERPEEFRIRRGGLVPEAVEVALVGEALDIVDGAPQHAYRHAVPQARRPHGAVDGNQTARMPHDLRIVAGLDEDYPVGHPMASGDSDGVALAVDKVAVVGVILDKQEAVLGGMLRKRADHHISGFTDAGERGIHKDLVILIELQRKEEIGPCTVEDRPEPCL